MSKYRVGEKSKNDNRVDSFIWHLGVSSWSHTVSKNSISGGCLHLDKIKRRSVRWHTAYSFCRIFLGRKKIVYLISWKYFLDKSVNFERTFFFNSPKKQTINLCPSRLGQKFGFSSSFFGRIGDIKKTFRN